eukprot:CAMPEP_0177680912 /NCGR_PEP_ID=MMETSP0447-20121125/30425_1 /TAXON_ID=0 /ORGANISM="Stygamoeba regulata, Strain BSH-02190019" /LENGTH=73 /DNA_ID=CAMNT_0019190273 /DNA_START=220 /DNA_END=441 /DNA_ORIENTATION=+
MKLQKQVRTLAKPRIYVLHLRHVNGGWNVAKAACHNTQILWWHNARQRTDICQLVHAPPHMDTQHWAVRWPLA